MAKPPAPPGLAPATEPRLALGLKIFFVGIQRPLPWRIDPGEPGQLLDANGLPALDADPDGLLTEGEALGMASMILAAVHSAAGITTPTGAGSLN